MMKTITILLLIFINFACLSKNNGSHYVNTSHLDHLYEEVVVNGDTLGIIHIYAEYPDYKWVDDSDEGTSCVDDVSRAMIFYLNDYKYTGSSESINKAKKLLNYILYMQSENGFFYNFTWKDNTINKEFKTSVAEPNWWSWRALWALAEANRFFKIYDAAVYSKTLSHLEKIVSVTIEWLNKENNYGDFSGFKIPLWLPYESAADQAAIILKGLALYYESEKDTFVIPTMNNLMQGIIKMQAGDENTFPYSSFLSWQNTWHAWGNSQAEALLIAGDILKDTSAIHAALKEINHFYSFLYEEKYLSDFVVNNEENKITITKQNKYPQIAYSVSPMILASIKAYQITNEKKYAELAGKITCWFFGDNAASAKMYDPETGRCFDGIVSAKKINKNSGAESTIECLLSLQMIEQIPEASEVVSEYIMNYAEKK